MEARSSGCFFPGGCRLERGGGLPAGGFPDLHFRGYSCTVHENRRYAGFPSNTQQLPELCWIKLLRAMKSAGTTFSTATVRSSKRLAFDVCQQVMTQFFRQSRSFRFDPGIARFRTYFGRIVQGKIADFYRRKREIPVAEFEAVPIEPEAEQLFMDEWRRMVLKEAEQELKQLVPPRNVSALSAFCRSATSDRKDHRLSGLFRQSGLPDEKTRLCQVTGNSAPDE